MCISLTGRGSGVAWGFGRGDGVGVEVGTGVCVSEGAAVDVFGGIIGTSDVGDESSFVEGTVLKDRLGIPMNGKRA